MKRLFTIALIVMVTSLTFAQAPLAKKKVASVNRLERLADVNALAKKAKEAKELKAAMAEKAAAADETASSVLRKSSVKRGFFNSVKEGKVIGNLPLGSYRSEVSNRPYRSSVRKTITQEGNVTVTTDANGIILDVAGVEPKLYQRATTGTAYFNNNGQFGIASQSGMVTIVEDGANVYIKNPITRYTTGAWVKGTKSGNVITVSTRQPLNYIAQYGATISLRWGFIGSTDSKIHAADDHAEAITFTVDGNVLTLEGTTAFDGTADAYFIGAFWDDDNSFSGYGDAETVLTYDPSYVAPSTELVTLPAGVEYTGWYMNCVSLSNTGETPVKNQKVNVAFAGNDVYVQGISADFPDAWVKGTIEGTNIKFDKFQYVGDYSSYNCWLIGVNTEDESIEDAIATYDAQAKTITFTNYVLVNADAFEIYYLNWFVDVVVSADELVYQEPVITDLTAALPYTNTFDTEAEQAQAAIYDANDDKSTFTFDEHSTTNSKVARYRYSTKNTADDYLVFPGVELKAGTKYKVSLDAAAYGPSYPERLEVVAGKEAKVSQLTIPVIAATVVADKEFNTLSNAEFTVEEDGTYYIAVHAISDMNQYYLYVDNFSVSELDASAPSEVSDLDVVADAQGANKAVVTFTVPSHTVSGTAITDKIDVVVKRDGEEILSEAKTAGENVVINDEVDAAGYYTYSVATSYTGHFGSAVTKKVYIGYDTPDIVNNITVADKSGSVAIAWEAPAGGAEGYIVNPADYKYNVYPAEIVEFFGMQFPMADHENPYATGLNETSANVVFDTNSGEHGFSYFAVTAENTTGESDDAYGAVVTGAPYEMPLFETVANGKLSYWWGTAVDQTNKLYEGGIYVSQNSSDGDGSCFEMYAKTAGWMNLQSGKIALAGTANPTLTFDYSAGGAVPLTVSIITPNDVKDIATLTAGSNFAPATISLVEFANEDWVRFAITGTFSKKDSAYIDNIRVYNMLDNNLVAKGITAPSKVQAGEDVTVAVTVENQGSKAADAYTVDLYCNDIKVQSVPGTALAANAKTTFTFTEQTNVMTASELVWKAVVEFADDNDKSDNTTSTVKTVVKTTNYPAVTDLTGAQNGNNVNLTWSEPDMSALAVEPVTDSFEDYEAFGVNTAGDWSFVDVDGSVTYGFENIQFPNMYSEMAYIVLDGSYSSFDETFAAHTGNKYMASFAAEKATNNDWMISPELSGDAQRVSFFARTYTAQYGAESFEFYYSTTGKDIADFVKVDGVAEVPEDWTEFTFDVPAGAKYFAIRCTSADRFIFLVDDVTYTPAGLSADDLSLVGYNVYRDGVKLTAEPVAESAYVDASVSDGEHSYVVTVVYDKGESAASNVFTIGVVDGINSVINASAKVSAVGRIITVTGAEGEQMSIITADGKTIFDGKAADVTRVSVNGGVYIVKVGKTVTKAVVK